MGGREGGGVGAGGGWEAEGGLNHPLAQRKSRCVLSKAQKQPQCTCQDKTVVAWEQFDTTCSLISAPQWHHTPHSGPS